MLSFSVILIEMLALTIKQKIWPKFFFGANSELFFYGHQSKCNSKRAVSPTRVGARMGHKKTKTTTK
jgi:hypothetical protein